MPKTAKPKTLAPSRRWRKLANDNGFTRRHPFFAPQLEPLKKKLLSIGGWAVCLPRIEEDLKKILGRGQIFLGRSQIILGEPNSCHSNCCCLWQSNEEFKICTGYALSKDGMWRQHSWCYTDKVIETTVKRIRYFGFIMTNEEAELFVDENF